MRVCIFSATYYGLLLWLLLHCALLTLAQLFRNHKCRAGHEHESTWKTARPTQVSDVTHSENIDAVSCRKKCKNVHWCLSIKEPKQNVATEIMSDDTSKKLIFGCFYRHPRKCVVLHMSIHLLLGQKQPSDMLKTHTVELIIIVCPTSVTASNYSSHYSLMFRSGVTHGDWNDSHQFL